MEQLKWNVRIKMRVVVMMMMMKSHVLNGVEVRVSDFSVPVNESASWFRELARWSTSCSTALTSWNLAWCAKLPGKYMRMWQRILILCLICVNIIEFFKVKDLKWSAILAPLPFIYHLSSPYFPLYLCEWVFACNWKRNCHLWSGGGVIWDSKPNY